MANLLHLLALLPLLSEAVPADGQCYTYSTSTITGCGPAPTTAPVQPTVTRPGETVTVFMPQCPLCTCEATYTKTYTTTNEVFCSTGVVDVTYTVKEIYKGHSTEPVFKTSTEVPHGFTTTVATCDACGPAPITRTFTLPSGAPISVSRYSSKPVASPTAASAHSTSEKPAPTTKAGEVGASPATPIDTPVAPSGSKPSVVPATGSGSRAMDLSGAIMAAVAAFAVF
ncbi:hypothetical protein NLG97_g1992 [Lecanicillium saksenae]|uniref:Uncharacterized protein n=1 Tax=Lecanicillium saksenae TaxID=468837 RepID=A0ACC1R2T2_9HYPO|nr:hypothetical protein NLG97_g1992 [Lecanicillium saksenae]